MLPLANILRNLDSRDNAGLVLAVIIIICLVFNIIVLLLRSFIFAIDNIMYMCSKYKRVPIAEPAEKPQNVQINENNGPTTRKRQ